MSKYMDDCVRNFGGLRYQVQVTGYNKRKIILWMDSIGDYYERKYCKLAMIKLGEYFDKNNYYVNKVHEGANGVTYEICNDIKNWERVYTNIGKLLTKELNKRVCRALVVRS